jgi:hypothetical protein
MTYPIKEIHDTLKRWRQPNLRGLRNSIIPLLAFSATANVVFVTLTTLLPTHFGFALTLSFSTFCSMLATFICFAVLYNFACSILVSCFVQPYHASAPNTTFCARCLSNRPAGAHHCSECDVCILDKNHHCLILGSCVGRNNIRYFVSFLFFLLAGTAWFLVLARPLALQPKAIQWPLTWLEVRIDFLFHSLPSPSSLFILFIFFCV